MVKRKNGIILKKVRFQRNHDNLSLMSKMLLMLDLLRGIAFRIRLKFYHYICFPIK